MSPDLIGWLASGILLLTLGRQIVQQARSDGEGVSIWLFAGQIASSIGFIVYSVLVGNWVFIVTNSAILLTAIIGQVVVTRKKQDT